MLIDLATRRTIRTLSGADLAAYPVWEWAMGETEQLGHDESFLRPTSLAGIALDVDAEYIVAAQAALNHDVTLPACVEVRVVGGKARLTPLFLVVLNRHLDFCGDETTRVLNQYTRKLNTFAVRWQLAVPVGAATPARKVQRPLAVRLQQCWTGLRVAATGAGVLTP